jgi:stearoyl-CoA desaturase (delta-9 desaturase)
MEWWQFDLSAWLIRALEQAKLVWNVYRVRPDDARKRRADSLLQPDMVEGA